MHSSFSVCPPPLPGRAKAGGRPAGEARLQTQRIRAAVLSAALLVPAACSGAHPASDEAVNVRESRAPVPIAVSRVRTLSFSQPIELSGNLSAVQSVTLGAISGGKVNAVNVRSGDRVRTGQVVARVDASGYQAGLSQARAGLAAASDNERAAEAQLAAARSRLELARTTAGRMAQLYAQGAISRQQRDETMANLAAAQAGVAQAQAGRSASANVSAEARSGVVAASVPLDNATLTAPFDGVVTAKFVEPGAVVGPGSPVLTIQNTDDLELDVAVPNDDVAALVPGAPLRVRVDALGNATLTARVRAIVPMENPALRSATVKVSLDEHPGLLPGMFARVNVDGKAHQGAAVPLAALVNRAGQSGVFAVRGTSVAFVPVQTGTIGERFVEVAGLSGRAQDVAVTNLQRLTDGTAVSVAP
jgi:RND family efflux transporter MFP subunit